MSLTAKEIQDIAQLSRLKVAADEVDDYVAKLSNILDLVAQLDQVDTSGVEPMAHPLNMAQRLRPDEVTATDRRDLYQQNASDVAQGLYRVPRVIE